MDLEKFIREKLNQLEANQVYSICTDSVRAWIDDAANIDALVLKCPYEVAQFFFANHYDVFNLIGNGLAVDMGQLKF